HRSLHSFPTRRSSDLVPRSERRRVATDEECVAGEHANLLRQAKTRVIESWIHELGANLERSQLQGHGTLEGPVGDLRKQLAIARDRKSTRLNSSHLVS